MKPGSGAVASGFSRKKLAVVAKRPRPTQGAAGSSVTGRQKGTLAMLYRIAALALLTVTTAASEVWPNRDPDTLVVHEWGTFTSIAGTSGDAISWLPLQAANDLPCFVDRFRNFRP